MIVTKMVMFAIGLYAEFHLVQGVLEYFDNKKYAEQDAEYEKTMAYLKSLK